MTAAPVSLRDIVLALREAGSVGKAAFALRRSPNALTMRMKAYGFPRPKEILKMEDREVQELLAAIDSHGRPPAEKRPKVRRRKESQEVRRLTVRPLPDRPAPVACAAAPAAPDGASECSPVEEAVIRAQGSYSKLAEVARRHGLTQAGVLQMHHRLRASGVQQ